MLAASPSNETSPDKTLADQAKEEITAPVKATIDILTKLYNDEMMR